MDEWKPILAKWNSDTLINILSLTSILKYVIMKDMTSDGNIIIYSKNYNYNYNNEVLMKHLLKRLDGNEYVYYIKNIFAIFWADIL